MEPISFPPGWFGVRCIFQWPQRECYEERVTMWRAQSFEEAIRKAELEAAEYAETHRAAYLGLAQAFRIYDDHISEGSEVFSLLRPSELGVDDYLETFYDTGEERQLHLRAGTPRST